MSALVKFFDGKTMIVDGSALTPNGYLPPDFDMATNKGDACTKAIYVAWYPVQYENEKGERAWVFYDTMNRVFYFLKYVSWNGAKGDFVLDVVKFEQHYHNYISN